MSQRAERGRLEARWNDPSILETFGYYERMRRPFRPALRQLLTTVAERAGIRQGARVIEIGSGIGELANNLLPEFRYTIQQTEQSDVLLETYRQLSQRPGSVGYPVMHKSSLYELPTQNADVIIGLSVLDTIDDIDFAVGVLEKNLRPGGRLVHVQDIIASTDTWFHNYERGGDTRIALPIVRDNTSRGVALVDRETVNTALQNLTVGQGLHLALESFIADPLSTHDRLEQENLLVPFARSLLDLIPQIETSEQVIFNDYFYNRLRLALEKHGFVVESFGEEEASLEVERDEKYRNSLDRAGIPSDASSVRNDVSYVSWEQEKKLSDQVEVTSKSHVMIARKPTLSERFLRRATSLIH